jgi:transposase
MERISYSTYSVGKGKEYSFEFKFDAVFAAQELGIKPTSKKFKIAVNTIKSWLKRFKKHGKKGLEDQRKGPRFIPNKISADEEEKIISIRKMVSCFGPVRIKHFFNISCSLSTIRRVIRSHGLTRKRKKAHVKRRDLRKVKAKRPAMTHLQMDVKHLYDIPNYWEQLKPLALPKYQYTVRDTKSGMLFLGYSDELSEINARTMIDYVLNEMKLDLPFDINQLTVQTDNGTEFSGLARRMETAMFVQMIEKVHGAKHVYIRPGHCNANADVESSHELIETEFFDLTRFADREDFFKKVESYRLYFNFTRPNFYKGTKTPVEICKSDWNATVSYNFSLIKTVDLDKISNFSYQKGQTIPNLADRFFYRFFYRLFYSHPHPGV